MVGLQHYSLPSPYSPSGLKRASLPEDIVELLASHMYWVIATDARGWPTVDRQRRFLGHLSVSRSWRQTAKRLISRTVVFEHCGRQTSGSMWRTNLALINECTVVDVYVTTRHAHMVADAVLASQGLDRKRRQVVRRLHVSVIPESYDSRIEGDGTIEDDILGKPWFVPMHVVELSLDCRTPGALVAVESCCATLRRLRLSDVPGHMAGHIACHWPQAFPVLHDLALRFCTVVGLPNHGDNDVEYARPARIQGLRSLKRLAVRQCPAAEIGTLLASLAPAGQRTHRLHVQIELGWQTAGISEMLSWLAAHNNSSRTMDTLDISCVGPSIIHLGNAPLESTALGVLRASANTRHLRMAMDGWPQMLERAPMTRSFSMHNGLRSLDLNVRVSLKAVHQLLRHMPELWRLRAAYVATHAASLEECLVQKTGVWSWSLQWLLLAFDGSQVGCDVLGGVAVRTAERLPALQVLVLDARVADAVRTKRSAHVRHLTIRDRSTKW
ncbi:hypothetical protein IW150_004050 [Coemansia sp. RSA 2607]|nr:hypothetical protein IW150_004050 [Coemansia sp. RSA 2607]